MSLLEKSLQIALEAHRGQVDRAGRPYILHPLRIMSRMRTDSERIVAILHDVVEDSDWTLDDLRQEGFPEDLVHAVDCLTKREGKPYDDLIERAASDPIARQVKLGDLEDNMDIRRNLQPLGQEDLQRFEKYRKAWLQLTS